MKDDAEILLSNYVSFDYEKDSVGSVDELGFYALIHVKSEEEQKEVSEGVEDMEWLTPGWYIYKEDTYGNAYYAYYVTEGEAEHDYRQIEENYERFYS